MSKIKLTGHASGSGVLTIAAPNTDSDRTITLPDVTGTLLDSGSDLPAANLTGTVADARISALTASKLTGALPALDGSALTGIDLESIRRDIATLALHSAVADNKAAYNLPNSFIDQFEDDTGIGTETDVDRNDNEYVIPIVTTIAAFTSDSNTLALLHFDGTNNSTLITDSSSHSRTVSRTSTEGGRPKLDTDTKKFGTASVYFGNGTGGTGSHGNALSMGDSSAWNFANNNFTFETWIKLHDPVSASGNGTFELGNQAKTNSTDVGGALHWNIQLSGSNMRQQFNSYQRNGSNSSEDFNVTGSINIPEDEWVHLAACRDGTTLRLYVNGVQDATTTIGGNGHVHEVDLGGDWWISKRAYTNNYGYIRGHMDEYRLSNNTRYPSGTTFIPNATTVVNATGTLISTAQTASSAQTKVSGVILYKNNAGTATLGTDLKVYFTCNGGTNWTESTPAAAGTFSTGILMAKCPEVTCTSGTDVRYKVVWANQASGSKETQLHGIAMNY